MKLLLKTILLLPVILSFSVTLNCQTVGNKDSAGDIWKKIAPYFSVPPEYEGNYGKYRSPLKFYDGHPVRSKNDWEERRNEILAKWHDMMGPWPPLIKNREMEIIWESTRRDGFREYRVSFFKTPDEKTDGYLLVPDGEGPMPAVITVFYFAESAIGFGTSAVNLDFAYQLTKRGFVTLSIGIPSSIYYPDKENATVQPLSMLAYAAANAWYVLSKVPQVDSTRIGIIGHSYGGKWAMFASCLFDKFACSVWSDPGIVFDEKRGNVNYWEPWYLGYHKPPWRKGGMITAQNPAGGLYPKLVEEGFDLHELHALMAPRPFLVSGGAEDSRERWIPLNHTIAVNKFLGFENRVAMTNRSNHSPDPESNSQVYLFFEYFLKYKKARIK